MVLVMVLLLAKQIITLYHAVQKILTKDQHALAKTELEMNAATNTDNLEKRICAANDLLIFYSSPIA